MVGLWHVQSYTLFILRSREGLEVGLRPQIAEFAGSGFLLSTVLFRLSQGLEHTII